MSLGCSSLFSLFKAHVTQVCAADPTEKQKVTCLLRMKVCFQKGGRKRLIFIMSSFMFLVLHWHSFPNVPGVLGSPTPLGQVIELLKSEAALFLCPYMGGKIGQENVLGEKREHKACPVGWLTAKAGNSQFSLCAKAWLPIPGWSAFKYRDAKLMHCSLGNDIFLLLLPGKRFCMKGIKWHEALCLAGDRNQWLGSMLVVSL